MNSDTLPNNQHYNFTLGGDVSGLSKCRYGTTSLKLTSFFGYCYFCDYARHSQNYCPLRKCSICSQYGHSCKVCPTNKMLRENWRIHADFPRERSFKTWKCKNSQRR